MQAFATWEIIIVTTKDRIVTGNDYDIVTENVTTVTKVFTENLLRNMINLVGMTCSACRLWKQNLWHDRARAWHGTIYISWHVFLLSRANDYFPSGNIKDYGNSINKFINRVTIIFEGMAG